MNSVHAYGCRELSPSRDAPRRIWEDWTVWGKRGRKSGRWFLLGAPPRVGSCMFTYDKSPHNKFTGYTHRINCGVMTTTSAFSMLCLSGQEFEVRLEIPLTCWQMSLKLVIHWFNFTYLCQVTDIFAQDCWLLFHERGGRDEKAYLNTCIILLSTYDVWSVSKYLRVWLSLNRFIEVVSDNVGSHYCLSRTIRCTNHLFS